MKRSGFLPILCVIFCLLAVLGAQGGYYIYKYLVMEPFTKTNLYEIDYSNAMSVRDSLADNGLDVSIPCVPEGGGSFTMETDFDYYRFNQLKTIPAGSEITTDFFNYGSGKLITMILYTDKRELEIHVTSDTLLDAYLRYLRQNGLEEQFAQETGAKLTRRSAKKALLTVEKVCYEEGIVNFGRYPVDLSALKETLNRFTWAVPAAIILLFVLLSLLISRRRDEQMWAVWFRGNQARYDEVSLPEFHSLRDSDQARLRPMHRKLTFGEKVRGMFERRGK